MLIELLVVMSMLTALLAGMAGLVVGMLRVEAAERAQVVAASALDRLARDLRRDARAATGPAEVGDDRLVLPTTDGRSVEYADRGKDVARTVRRGGKVEHFETYRRPKGSRCRFESGRDGPRPTLAIFLMPETGSLPDPAYRDFRIEAVPGRDARLAGRAAP